MSWVATTNGVDAALVGNFMLQAEENRLASMARRPDHLWLTDNGSCYTAAEIWGFAKQLGLKPVTTPVSCPQSNGMANSFVKTLKLNLSQTGRSTRLANGDGAIDQMVRRLQFLSPAHCIGLRATHAVQGKTSGKLNIPAVLGCRLKIRQSLWNVRYWTTEVEKKIFIPSLSVCGSL